MSEATDLLNTINADVLSALARRVGAPSKGTRKAESVEALDRLIHGDVRRILEHLTETEKKLLSEAAYGDGSVDAERFQAKYGMPAPLPKASRYYTSKASPLLLFVGDYYGARRIPGSVAKVLREALEEPATPGVTVTDTLPATSKPRDNWRHPGSRPIHVFESEPTVFLELRSVLNLVRSGKLRVAPKSRRPTEAASRIVGQSLVAPDFQLDPPAERSRADDQTAGAVRAHAWAVLAQQCGWAAVRSGKLVLSASGRELLSSFDVATFTRGVARFVWDDKFDELNRINHIRGQSGKGRRHLTPPGGRRGRILGSMEKWPVNRWIAFEEAARFILASGNGFDVADETYYLYFGELQYGSLNGSRQQINRQYLRAFLFESLATLGLVDVAYTYPHSLWPELGDSWGVDDLDFCGRYDGLLYVRLNALGAYCLGLSSAYEAPASLDAGNFRVLPNREVMFVGAGQPSIADRHMLELFASRKSDLVWILDRARLLNHLESGGSVGDAVDFLERSSASELPDTIRTMLTDLAGGAAAVAGAQEALLIEWADEATAALIAHDTRAAKYCRLAGDRHVAVPKKNLKAFRAAIKKLGFVIPNERLPK